MKKSEILKIVREHMADCSGISQRDIDDHGERIAFRLEKKFIICHKACEELKDAYEASEFYVREDGFRTPRQAMARLAAEIDRLKIAMAIVAHNADRMRNGCESLTEFLDSAKIIMVTADEALTPNNI